MMFRVLKFRPDGNAAAAAVLRPVISRDTEFFWAGTAAGELRIQHCGACGLPRHPPGPACPRCGALRPKYVVAGGTGEVYSYVVHHHPPAPGRKVPFVVALVELAEGSGSWPSWWMSSRVRRGSVYRCGFRSFGWTTS
jgi:uncharacterized OB-fold protein